MSDILQTRTLEQLRAELADCNRRIAKYPHWGAALAALDEWRTGLKREINRQSDGNGGE
jgi:hypothetical protein